MERQAFVELRRAGGKEGVSVVSVNGDGKGGLQDVDSPFLHVLFICISSCILSVSISLFVFDACK